MDSQARAWCRLGQRQVGRMQTWRFRPTYTHTYKYLLRAETAGLF